MRICLQAFDATQYQMKRLNAALDFTLTLSITSKRNMKNFRFFESHHLFKHVDLFKQNFTNFYALLESKRYKFGNNACEKQWVGCVQFLRFIGKTKSNVTKHNVLFFCSEDVILSYQRQSFVQFGWEQNNRNCGYIPIVSINKWPLSSMEYVLKTLNLFDDHEIFGGYTTTIELYNALERKFTTKLGVFLSKRY